MSGGAMERLPVRACDRPCLFTTINTTCSLPCTTTTTPHASPRRSCSPSLAGASTWASS